METNKIYIKIIIKQPITTKKNHKRKAQYLINYNNYLKF